MRHQLICIRRYTTSIVYPIVCPHLTLYCNLIGLFMLTVHCTRVVASAPVHFAVTDGKFLAFAVPYVMVHVHYYVCYSWHERSFLCSYRKSPECLAMPKRPKMQCRDCKALQGRRNFITRTGWHYNRASHCKTSRRYNI